MTAPDFLLIIGAISGDNGESGTQVSFKRVTAICCEAGQEARFKAPNPISRGAKNAAVAPAIRGLSRARKRQTGWYREAMRFVPVMGRAFFILIKKLLQSASLTAPSKRELWALSNLFFEGRLKSLPFVADLDDKNVEGMGMAEGAERPSRSGRNSLFKQ